MLPRNNRFHVKLLVGILLPILVIFFVLGASLRNINAEFSLDPKFYFSLLFNLGSKKEDSGRTNFLIMGIGGKDHEGPDLTDSLIFLSLNSKTKKTVLVSIPRDIWVPEIEEKVNTAYAIGEVRGKGKGLPLARKAISEIIGEPIHYVAVVDFDFLKELIDLLGGIDVVVDRTFDDFKYPKEDKNWEASTSGNVYEHLHFDKGLTHMDGITALKYTRSRYSTDLLEGTDFARSKRQQKVFIAIKDKIIKDRVYLDFGKVAKIAQIGKSNIDTDISKADFPFLSRLIFRFDDKNLKTVILDEGTKEKPGFLINPPVSEYGSWVLIPRSGSWKTFQDYLKKELEK